MNTYMNSAPAIPDLLHLREYVKFLTFKLLQVKDMSDTSLRQRTNWYHHRYMRPRGIYRVVCHLYKSSLLMRCKAGYISYPIIIHV